MEIVRGELEAVRFLVDQRLNELKDRGFGIFSLFGGGGGRGTREELRERRKKKNKRTKEIVSWSEARERFDGASCILSHV